MFVSCERKKLNSNSSSDIFDTSLSPIPDKCLKGDVCGSDSVFDADRTCQAYAGENIRVCSGQSTTLTASGGNTYTWYKDGLVIQGPISNPNIVVNSQGTYTVEVTDANGCTDVDDVTLTMLKLPTAQLSTRSSPSANVSGSILSTFENGDEDGRTGIKFSIDGGLSYPYIFNDNWKFANIDVLPDDYDVYVAWGNGECPVDLGTATVFDHNTYDLILLAGQSNMRGRGLWSEKTPFFHPSDIQEGIIISGNSMFDIETEYVGFGDFQHMGPHIVRSPQTNMFEETFSIHHSLTKNLYERRYQKLAMINGAIGSSKIVEWQKGRDNYYQFLTRIIDDVDALRIAGKNVNLIGLGWLQGESDRNLTKSEYKFFLNRMLSHMKTDLHWVFSHDSIDRMKIVLIEPARPYGLHIDEDVPNAMDEYANEHFGVSFVPTYDLVDKVDDYHWNTESLDEIGKRFSDVISPCNDCLPSVDAGEDIRVCSGESTSLPASGGDSYTWYKDGFFLYGPTANANIISNGEGIYTVEAIGTQGYRSISSVWVNELKLPLAEITTQRAPSENGFGAIIPVFENGDEDGRTNIKFSINGGVSYPYRFNDNLGSGTIDVLPGSYHVLVQWGNGDCTVDLGWHTVGVNAGQAGGNLDLLAFWESSWVSGDYQVGTQGDAFSTYVGFSSANKHGLFQDTMYLKNTAGLPVIGGIGQLVITSCDGTVSIDYNNGDFLSAPTTNTVLATGSFIGHETAVISSLAGTFADGEVIQIDKKMIASTIDSTPLGDNMGSNTGTKACNWTVNIFITDTQNNLESTNNDNVSVMEEVKVLAFDNSSMVSWDESICLANVSGIGPPVETTAAGNVIGHIVEISNGPLENFQDSPSACDPGSTSALGYPRAYVTLNSATINGVQYMYNISSLDPVSTGGIYIGNAFFGDWMFSGVYSTPHLGLTKGLGRNFAFSVLETTDSNGILSEFQVTEQNAPDHTSVATYSVNEMTGFNY